MKKLLLVAAFAWIAVGVVVSAGQAPRPAARRAATAQAQTQAPSQAPARLVRAQATTAAAAAALPTATPAEAKALVTRYCVGCHNTRSNTPAANPLKLDSVNFEQPEKDALTWERVIRKLSVGAMPPQGMPHPEPAALTAFATFLTTTLDRASAQENNPGNYVAHRLNRTEYENAVRDLVGVDFDAATLLPSDGGDFGFDNIATALKTSPLLLERYLAAALRISTMAIGDTTVAPGNTAYPISLEHSQNTRAEGLPLGTRGGTLIKHVFPADGDYYLYGRLVRAVLNGYVGIEGHEVPHDFLITVDGETVYEAPVGGFQDHKENGVSPERMIEVIDGRLKARVFVTAGLHEIGFTWKDISRTEQAVWEPPRRDSQEVHMTSGPPRLKTVNIEGPYDPKGISDTPSRDRIFVCKPASAADESACAQRIFTNLARRAFRRPVNAADVAAPMAFYTDARQDGGNFDAGIRSGVARILASPSFIYRVERDPDALPAGAAHRVSDYELASRLSFFLWSSIPDEQLLNLASAGRLRQPAVLAAQVRRMVADPKADAFVDSFTGQWLALRSLEARVSPDVLMFPHFDDNVRKAFRTETEMFFASMLRDDRPIPELLTATYTFLNERLAKHYGIKGVYGERFRRVEITDPHRRGLGLLGQGSLLSVTSVATRTSPTIRGKYILTTLMGLPAPVPPPNVPALDESSPQSATPKTTRQRVESHRTNPVCASCHRTIDPLGFALENFDSTGAWRDLDGGNPIDVSGVMADGTPIDSAAAVRNWFTKHQDVFVNNVAERMMIYALGRGLEPNDMPVVRSIVKKASQDDYRFMSVIMGIVDSAPFQMRTKPAQTPGDTTLQANSKLE
jgi:mono/diheme cytochrome c family protein